jgi:general stress protein YciG
MKTQTKDSPVFNGMAQVIPTKQMKGFACISPERRKEIASKGGKSISSNREHMAAIGSKGGKISQLRKKRNKALLKVVTGDQNIRYPLTELNNKTI